MSTTDLPYLKRTTTASPKGADVVLIHLDDEITLDGAAAALFNKISAHLDGKTSLAKIAESTGESATRVRGLTEQLASTGALSFLSKRDEDDRMKGTDFYQLHKTYCAHWLKDIYGHSLWEKITNGTASRAQVIGFAFEKYHYIEGAYEHMGIAAANATPEMMPHLARHFIEEYLHGDIYRKGLRSLFPDDVVLSAQPLPSTRALVNFLSESAHRNSFSYYAGNELLQMTENTAEDEESSSIDDFYAAMRKHYPWSGRLIDSFIAHTNADQKLGHKDVFFEMCESIPPLTRKEVSDAMDTSRSMCEHLKLFMDGIELFYDRFPTVPRVPCDLLSE